MSTNNANEFSEKMSKIQSCFLSFIENQNKEKFFQNLIQLLHEDHDSIDTYELRSFLNLLVIISNNHKHEPDFFAKIEKILNYYKEEIRKYFSNFELFTLFSSNKRILLYLINEKMLIIDADIYKVMAQEEYKRANYIEFFFPEIHQFQLDEKSEKYQVPDDFEEKRKIGENDSYICQLIRKDLIEDFVAYVNKTNTNLDSKINPSIFETNQFLNDNKMIYLAKLYPSLIEYAAFFGSIQIYQYLRLNRVKLTSYLWLYAIHGKNAEIIHLLEEDGVELDFRSLEESIKCHHNEITDYLIETYDIFKNEENYNIQKIGIQYYDYHLIAKNNINESSFFYLCCYNNLNFVRFLLKDCNIDVNSINKIFDYLV